MIYTLIFTIIRHFISTPSNITSRIHDQLSNLRCPTMRDIRWYEAVFTSRVMVRDDSNKPFWKEKFIDGLPNLFAHKIITVFSNSNRIIDYGEILRSRCRAVPPKVSKIVIICVCFDKMLSGVVKCV
jgi:hypothetical protein